MLFNGHKVCNEPFSDGRNDCCVARGEAKGLLLVAVEFTGPFTEGVDWSVKKHGKREAFLLWYWFKAADVRRLVVHGHSSILLL